MLKTVIRINRYDVRANFLHRGVFEKEYKYCYTPHASLTFVESPWSYTKLDDKI